MVWGGFQRFKWFPTYGGPPQTWAKIWKENPPLTTDEKWVCTRYLATVKHENQHQTRRKPVKNPYKRYRFRVEYPQVNGEVEFSLLMFSNGT